MIVIKNLKKLYGEQVVLDGLSTEIHKGEIVAVLGASGSGKSTLLRCINRLEEPTSGSIFLDKVEITEANIFKIRARVGMVFQSFNLFSNMSVLQNLIYAPLNSGRFSQGPGAASASDKEVILDKARNLLKKVGLENKANASPQTLSGGEKQRIAIARTLMMDPEVILFDEPTSALDPEMVQEVLRVIQGLSSSGITILIVTHEMNFVKDVATRVLFLDKGKILEDQNPQEFFEGHTKERISMFLNKVSKI